VTEDTDNGEMLGADRETSRRVDIVDRSITCSIPGDRLAEVARFVLAAEGIDCAEISVSLVDDREMAQLHVAYMQVEGPTDVLTFDLADTHDTAMHGEIVISVETATRLAGELAVDVAEEVALYLVHGLLHLCGFDDIDDVDRGKMRQREGELLDQLGISVRVRA
tara:strand:+ start:1298 stop:1792 length:495 start_codon:yes stop_codon:yes gene_type:complete